MGMVFVSSGFSRSIWWLSVKFVLIVFNDFRRIVVWYLRSSSFLLPCAISAKIDDADVPPISPMVDHPPRTGLFGNVPSDSDAEAPDDVTGPVVSGGVPVASCTAPDGGTVDVVDDAACAVKAPKTVWIDATAPAAGNALARSLGIVHISRGDVGSSAAGGIQCGEWG